MNQSSDTIERNSRHLDTTDVRKSLRARSLRGGVITTVAQVIKLLLSLASIAILSRFLDAEQFGLVAMTTPIVGFIAMFKDLGLSTATVQREEITHQQVSSLFWVNVYASLGMTLIAAVASPFVGYFYNDHRTAWITLFSAGTFVLGGLTVQHQAILQRQMRFGALAIADIASISVGLGVGAWGSHAGWGYWALVAMSGITAAVNCVVVWLFCEWRPSLPGSLRGIRELCVFGGQLTTANILAFLTMSVPSIFLGRFCGATDAGLYNRAFSAMLGPINQALGPLRSVLLPAVSRIDDNRRLEPLLKLVVELVAIISVPLFVSLLCFGDWLVLVLFGAKWTNAIPLVRVMAFSVLLNPVYGLLLAVLPARGLSGFMAKWFAVLLVAQIAFCAAGVGYGTLGVAVSLAVLNILIVVAFLRLVQRALNVRLYDGGSIGRFALSLVVSMVLGVTFRLCLKGVSLYAGLSCGLGLIWVAQGLLLVRMGVLSQARQLIAGGPRQAEG